MLRTFLRVAGVVMALSVVTGTASVARAERGDHEDRGNGRFKVPEISGRGAAAALALVVGGAAVVIGRRKRRSS